MGDEIVKLTGTVSPVDELLESPLGKRACVYWDVREGLSTEPRQRGSRSFWLEDESGRVLVQGDHVDVDARAERREQLVAVAESDLQSLSQRLREVKAKLKTVQGERQRLLDRERRHLASVATLLLATRAHARGKIHVAGSLDAQADWIRKHAEKASRGHGAATAMMALDAWEVVIEPGQRVCVEGPCEIETMSPEHRQGDGYRSRQTGRVMRGSAAAPLRITGVGAIAPLLEPPPKPKRFQKQRGERSRPNWMAIGLFWAIGLLVAYLLLFGR